MGKLKFSGAVMLKVVPLGKYSLSKFNLAKPKTLSPFLPKERFTASNFLFHSASMDL